ncbi:unnamed protein product [Cyprideis torosa]|uniref:Uncharacterized protein n=1 Tax=Cyprideis torosa TaxID=163714 RepID=A0A7R8ZTM0_9CRUS|nr:unnamed protein product [Cyprideis torosa]CAG0907797.1 unnamed protein product [Cyprideis torosa]
MTKTVPGLFRSEKTEFLQCTDNFFLIVDDSRSGKDDTISVIIGFRGSATVSGIILNFLFNWSRMCPLANLQYFDTFLLVLGVVLQGKDCCHCLKTSGS